MKSCASCAELLREGVAGCPHCGAASVRPEHNASKAAILLGLVLASGCPGEEVQALYGAPYIEDSGATDTDDTSDSGDQALYGVPSVNEALPKLEDSE